MCKLKHPQMKKFTKYYERLLFEMMKDLKLRDKVWLWISRRRCCKLYQIGFIEGYYKNKS